MAARKCVLLAATADAEAFFLLLEGPLLVAANPLQLLLYTHPWSATLPSTQLLFDRAAWTLLFNKRGPP